MANLKKYSDKGNALNALLDHVKNEREVRERRDNVDPSRIGLNYCLTFRGNDMSDREYIDERLKDLEYRERKDTVKAISVCLSVPKDYTGDKDAFFRSFACFLAERYGVENVVNVYVHRDEWNAKTHEPIQDHAHALVIPVVDRDKEVQRLNAKEFVSRQELKTFHKDLERHLEKDHIHARVLNGATRDQREYIQTLEHSRDFLKREIDGDRETQDRYEKYMQQQKEIDKSIEEQKREEQEHKHEHEHGHGRR